MRASLVTLREVAVEVTLSHTARRWTDFGSGVLDRRFLAAVVVLVASGYWLDAAHHWLATQAWSADVEQVLRGAGLERVDGSAGPSPAAMRGQPGERVVTSASTSTDGPLHLNDDAVTGVGTIAGSSALSQPTPTRFRRTRGLMRTRMITRPGASSVVPLTMRGTLV